MEHWRGKKLGIVGTARPENTGFLHATGLAQAALNAGVDVYLYCTDEAVLGLEHTRLKEMRPLGLKLYACALSARKWGVALNETAAFSGLAVVHDMIQNTDRFLAFH